MKISLPLIMVVLTGCASYGGEKVELPSGMVWTQKQIDAFTDWDNQGSCQPSVWSIKQARHCVTWTAISYCDVRLGYQSTWRHGGRNIEYMECVQDRFDLLAAQYDARRQATGQAMMGPGTEMMKEPQSDSFTCQQTSSTIVQCTEGS